LSFSGDQYPNYANKVITTRGDIIRGSSTGARERLGIGSANKVLQSDGTDIDWETLATADSTLTTQGDILYESASGLARLGQSTDGYFLTTKGAGANPTWTAAGGFPNPADANLDMATFDISDIGTVSADTVEVLGGVTSTQLYKKFEADFSADTVDPRFTFADIAGTGSITLDSGIDGGDLITAGASSLNSSMISLNDQQNFDLALHTQYGIQKNKTVGTGECRTFQGLSGTAANFASASGNFVCCASTGGGGNIILYSGNGSGHSVGGDSGVAAGTAKFAWKIITDGTNMRLYLIVSNIWSLVVTKTTNKPTGSGQPVGMARSNDGQALAVMIRYACQNDG